MIYADEMLFPYAQLANKLREDLNFWDSKNMF